MKTREQKSRAVVKAKTSLLLSVSFILGALAVSHYSETIPKAMGQTQDQVQHFCFDSSVISLESSEAALKHNVAFYNELGKKGYEFAFATTKNGTTRHICFQRFQ